MNYLSKYASRLATGIFVTGLALSLASTGQAQSAVQQAAGDSSASAAAAPAKTTQQQLDDLQKEMATLQQQIASLKAQQDAAPTVQAASFVTSPARPADDKVSLSSLLGPTTFSGTGDVYYGYDYNHPAFNGNPLTPFTSSTNSFGLNLAEFIVDKAPDSTSSDSRFGYHFAVGYGQAARAVNGSDIGGDGNQFYVKEAYATYLAPIGKGLAITVGKFVTPIGNEVIESSGNWNYTRGLLFYNAIPYFHFGASAKYTWNPKFNATFYLVNGWNNSLISHDVNLGNSSGLTYGASVAYTPNAKWSAIENYFAGPVIGQYLCDLQDTFPNCPTLNDWKQLSDTVISYTPNSKWAFALNGDYGFGPHNWTCPTASVSSCHTVGNQATWWGVAGYGKYTINPKSYFAARYEYYDDPDGYTIFGGDINPNDRVHLWEATGTYAYNVTSALQVRAEYRYDWASFQEFQTGANFDHALDHQHTAYLGFIYSFSSANAK